MSADPQLPDPDRELDRLDILGPIPAAVADSLIADPLDAAQANHPGDDIDHARHPGMCGTWCGSAPRTTGRYLLAGELVEFGLQPAESSPDVSAAGWHERMVERLGPAAASGRKGKTKRTRTATPPPTVPCRPAQPGELPANAAALLADALAAGWRAEATYSLGPLPSEQSPCKVCGTWARINQDGSLQAHGNATRDCDVLGPVTGAGACPCGRQLKATAKGWSAAKHKTPPVGCDNTTVDPDAGTWQMKPCVVVRARSARGHRVAAAWTDGSADGAWLVLAGDRPRQVGHDDLRATFRRLAERSAQTAPVASACPDRHSLTDGGQPDAAASGPARPAEALEGAPAGPGGGPAVLEAHGGAQGAAA